LNRDGTQIVFVDTPRSLFFSQELEGLFDRHFTRLALFTTQASEHAFKLLGHFLHAGRRHDFHLGSWLRDFDFDWGLIKLIFTQVLAERLARAGFFAY